MSIAVMTEVWRRSQHSGSHLLMMLALADFSDDQGCSYPAVTTLAAKCRMKPRNANIVLAALRDSGEIEIRLNAGPKGTNRYRIMVKALGGMQGNAGVQAAAGMQGNAGAASLDTLQQDAAPPAKACSKPLQPVADEPSLNRQEPSGRPKAAKRPACPFQDIIAIYHDVLPELPRVKVLETADRKRSMADFWGWVFASERSDGTKRATTAGEALAWIRAYFERARANDFVMNRTPRGPSHANWRADLDYLLSEKGRVQVIEKTEVAA
jgi:hypothetical protein